MSENNNSNSGIGLGGVIFIVFLVLKLGGIGQVANWSWWWVCSPLWIPLMIIGLVFVLALIWGYITR
mgnify:FL=1